jgi:hypothetical protein
MNTIADLYRMYRRWGAGRIRAACDALDSARLAWLYDRALQRLPECD